MKTLRLVFICKFYQSKLYGVSPIPVHVKTIAVFIVHVQQYYLAETLFSNIYVVGNIRRNNSFTFP